LASVGRHFACEKELGWGRHRRLLRTPFAAGSTAHSFSMHQLQEVNFFGLLQCLKQRFQIVLNRFFDFSWVFVLKVILMVFDFSLNARFALGVNLAVHDHKLFKRAFFSLLIELKHNVVSFGVDEDRIRSKVNLAKLLLFLDLLLQGQQFLVFLSYPRLK
jgi:hypothetical protein